MKNQKSMNSGSLFSFFVLAFVFSWLFWFIGVLASRQIFSTLVPNMAWIILGAHGPLIAAVWMTYKLEGWAAVKELLRAGFNFRMPLIWWPAILLTPLILASLAVWVSVSFNFYQPNTTLLSQPLMTIATFVMLFSVGGSFQEEFGWRGYALPRLLRSWNPLTATLILGAVWGFWHLSLFFISGASQSFMPFGVFVVLTMAFGILFTWFLLRTNNLFSALLFHTAINLSFSLFSPVEQRIGGNQTALAYLAIAYVLVGRLIVFKERSLWLKAAVE